jgi:predicted CXXCH cytochrome family protein
MSRKQKNKRPQSVLIILLLSLLWLTGYASALAKGPTNEQNEKCLTCHSNPDLIVEFADGSTISGHVSGSRYKASVHGQEEMTCGGCHPNHEEYPHPEFTIADSRTFTLKLNETCLECHPDQAERVQDSNHAQALAEGNTDAAVCVDCHGAHNTLSLHEARVNIAAACRQCHSTIYDEYNESAHGQALREEGNTDVPTCVDCHGIHTMEDPHPVSFRLKSPNLCGSCHADDALMSKYDISTDVFETYVADFHGTTVTLFEKQSPDAPTNKAVCFDCHGAHAIRAVDDPEAAVIKENLLVTCQKCHPEATANFPDSWTSHFPPTFDTQPLVGAVNLFYLILIPSMLGFMGLFVITDAGRKLISRGNKTGQPAPKKDDESKPKPPEPPAERDQPTTNQPNSTQEEDSE